MSHRQPFLNIRTEGSLLPSDLLSRLMEGTNLPGLKPEDYNLGAGEKLNEAISRSWTRLLSLWLGFRKAKAALPASDLGTTLTRERWLLQLFQELGYGRLIGASPFRDRREDLPHLPRLAGPALPSPHPSCELSRRSRQAQRAAYPGRQQGQPSWHGAGVPQSLRTRSLGLRFKRSEAPHPPRQRQPHAPSLRRVRPRRHLRR